MRAETRAAIRAAGIGQRIADSRVGAGEITSKGGIDLVTSADVACEDAIRASLLNDFPDYPVIGEERAGTARDGVPYWLVDPICGTRPYASNIPLYCTNIALVENGVATVAAIGLGRTNEILYAEKGAGAWMKDASGERRIAVSDRSNTIWLDGKSERAANAVRDALLLKRWYVWMFSSTVSYAYLACGQISGILHLGNPTSVEHGSVHTTAGCLVAAEAGAIVTDVLTGLPWNLQTRSYLLAATPEVQRELTNLIRVQN